MDSVISARGPSLWDRFWRRLFRHRLGMLGLSMLVALVFTATFAPTVARQDPSSTNLRGRNKPPSAAHILGTDGVGRDVWARLVYGSRVSLSVGIVAVGIYATIGILLGSIAGYMGGHVDNTIMRFTDMMMSFPTLLLIITAAAVLPPSILNVMIIIGIFGWTHMCRLGAGQFLVLREQEFVVAALSYGAPWNRIVFRHMLPNVVGPIVVACTLGLAGAILTERA